MDTTVWLSNGKESAVVSGPLKPESLDSGMGSGLGTVRAIGIINEVCNEYGMTLDELKSPKLIRKLVIPRHVAMARAYRETNLSATEVGELFNRHHTTVIHACRHSNWTRGEGK